MSENKHYCFDIPELCDAFIVGSSFGWLFAVRPNVDAYLVNPFSGAKFSLPSLPLYSNHSYLDSRKHLLDHIERDEMGWPLRHCIQNLHHFLVRKAVLSSDPSRCTDLVVFIVLAGQYHLAFYKPGDTTWTFFYGEKFVKDIVCFKGQFYVLLDVYIIATVDIVPEPKIRTLGRLPYNRRLLKSYLVNYNNTSLLHITQFRESDNSDKRHLITRGFRVFKVDLERYDTRCELKDINDNALFLGRNDSIVVRASDFNSCMANSLYFCDATIGFPQRKYRFEDMGVYNLGNKSMGHFYPPGIYHPAPSSPIWLVPNPL